MFLSPVYHPQGMHQLARPCLPRLRVQPVHPLPAGMEITSYNHHRRLLSSQRLCPQTKTTWVPIEPSLLSNQSFAGFAKGGTRRCPRTTPLASEDFRSSNADSNWLGILHPLRTFAYVKAEIGNYKSPKSPPGRAAHANPQTSML
jgi:hypothetical protein